MNRDKLLTETELAILNRARAVDREQDVELLLSEISELRFSVLHLIRHQLTKEAPMWFLPNRDNHKHLTQLHEEIHHMATTLAHLQSLDQKVIDAINRNIADTGLAIQALKDLKDQVAALKANSLDPAAVDALASDMETKLDALSASNAALEGALNPAPPATEPPADGGTTTTDPGTDPTAGSTGSSEPPATTDPAPTDGSTTTDPAPVDSSNV